jgi:hypothetical protein
MNAVEAINLSLPGYTGSATPFVVPPRGRSAQIFQIYTAQYATTINRPYSNLHSSQSAWSHIKGEMFTLIGRHSALVGPALPPAAPGPVVVNQQQHLPLRQPAVSPPPFVSFVSDIQHIFSSHNETIVSSVSFAPNFCGRSMRLTDESSSPAHAHPSHLPDQTRR